MIDTNHFKDLLEKELKTLESELKTVGRKNPANPDDWEPVQPGDLESDESDPIDVADKITAYEGNTAILKNLEIKYNGVKDALKRIEDGTYGKCEVCGKEIEEKRLEANTSATTCMEHMR